MSRLRVLLVDDEPLALDRLTALFRQVPDVDVVGTARHGQEASEKIGALAPDLVMLDIQMPEKSGLAVAADLPAELRPEIVFVTAFEQFAPDAFEVEAVDYILKPVRFERLRQAIDRAKRRRALAAAAVVQPEVTSENDAIWVQTKNGQVRVPVDHIEFVEAARDYVMLHTAARSHIHRTTMAALERRLDSRQLMRVHRSYFVRPGLVTAVQRHPNGSMSLTMRDGVAIQVGPNYVDAVTARLGLDAG
jgi:DNA-binding LytR/AlgR family response regulator